MYVCYKVKGESKEAFLFFCNMCTTPRPKGFGAVAEGATSPPLRRQDERKIKPAGVGSARL
jgi:hypothetical protein